MFHGRKRPGQKLLDRVDLAIDLVTLGSYGLEPLPAGGPCREQIECRTTPRLSGWEALPTARRGACGLGPPTPVDFRGAVARYAA